MIEETKKEAAVKRVTANKHQQFSETNTLTPKQERFCHEYIIDLNGTQAAIRAGSPEGTACSIASENLKKPEVRDYILDLMKERAERTKIEADKVLNEIGSIAFSNVKYLSEDAEKSVVMTIN